MLSVFGEIAIDAMRIKEALLTSILPKLGQRMHSVMERINDHLKGAMNGTIKFKNALDLLKKMSMN